MQKSNQISFFSFQITYFKVAEKVVDIWATLKTKFVAKIFIKSPKLVTLVTR